jgi:hypothetical protein
MLFRSCRSRGRFLLLALAVAGAASGCGPVREQVASVVRPASAQAVAAQLRLMMSEGKFLEAHKEGTAFLSATTDRSGGVAWELAKASAQLGMSAQAIRYARQALQAQAVAPVDLLTEPLLDPVGTDPRLVELAVARPGLPGRVGD